MEEAGGERAVGAEERGRDRGGAAGREGRDTAKWPDTARDLIRTTHRLYEYLLNPLTGQRLFCFFYEADTDPRT